MADSSSRGMLLAARLASLAYILGSGIICLMVYLEPSFADTATRSTDQTFIVELGKLKVTVGGVYAIMAIGIPVLGTVAFIATVWRKNSAK